MKKLLVLALVLMVSALACNSAPAVQASQPATQATQPAAPPVTAVAAPPVDTTTVDQFCVQMGEKMEKGDEAIQEQAKMVDDIAQSDPNHIFESYEENLSHALWKMVLQNKKIRKDACYSPDIATARATVRQDMEEGKLLVAEWKQAKEDAAAASTRYEATH